MADSVFQRSFAGGELSPSVHARADLVKYAQGLRKCQNFLVLKQGGIANRPGTRFVAATKQQTVPLRLMPYFAAEPEDSVLIEVGASYFRFYQGGAPLVVAGVPAWDIGTAYEHGDLVSDGGVNYYALQDNTGNDPPNATYWYPLTGAIYEIPHPFGVNLFDWAQSGEVITLTSHTHAPMELIFLSLTRWVLRDITTAPSIAAPINLAVTPGAAGTLPYGYLVTAADADTYEESLSSIDVTGTSAQPTEAAPNVITWDAVPNAAEYYVYKDKEGNGIYGYIGTAAVNAFKDTNFLPDYLSTPPRAVTLFSTAGNYPARAGYYQQRRFFANTLNDPQVIHASRVGLYSNFNISTPLQDDDALLFRLAGEHYHSVNHLVALNGLMALTAGGEWVVRGAENGVLTPSAIHADQETYAGVSPDVRPLKVGSTLVYLQARKSIVRDIQFNQEIQGLAGRDLTLYASHLFEGYSFSRMDYQQVPHSIVWAVRSDGTLLGLTYIPEQDVWGWHRHTTGASGVFLDVCVVPEVEEDVLYVLVRRTIGGAPKYYIERLESRLLTEFNEDVFFVDSGLSYSGTPADTFAGLEHLNGQVVAVVADGAVIYNGDPVGADAASFTVTGGQIVLDAEYSDVHIGLPIRFAEIELLDTDIDGQQVRDRKKRIGAVSVLLDKSGRTFWAGPDASNLIQMKAKPRKQPGVKEFTGQIEMTVEGSFSADGRVLIRQTDPLPLTIIGIIPNQEVGG